MQSLERQTIRKVLWRIIPFVFALYVVSYIDRANIGYAALQMNQELGLSSSAFGFAAVHTGNVCNADSNCDPNDSH